MTTHNRPLSPHLQVYRLPITGLISITHRITGIFLILGLMLFIYDLYVLATGQTVYDAMQGFMAIGVCRLGFWVFVYALFFHLCHGFRHLLWDIGATFNPATLQRYATYELIASALLTLLVFINF